MNPPSKTITGSTHVTLKMTPEQIAWLENTARFIESETGCAVSPSSILLRLMEHGLPQFEKDLQGLRARVNAEKKRFPRLQLIYTQHRQV